LREFDCKIPQKACAIDGPAVTAFNSVKCPRNKHGRTEGLNKFWNRKTLCGELIAQARRKAHVELLSQVVGSCLLRRIDSPSERHLALAAYKALMQGTNHQVNLFFWPHFVD